MKNKLVALTAVVALAAPAAAQAAKPAEPGKKGHTTAAAKKQAPKSQKVGFTLRGVLSTAGADFPTFTAGTGENADKSSFTDSFQVDLLSANKHARTALEIQKSAIEGTGVTTLDGFSSTDLFLLSYEGFGEDKTLAAGDQVKIIGKVVRTRSGKGKTATWTYGDVDIRKVVITREAPEAEPIQS
jgi:hypothetical protein